MSISKKREHLTKKRVIKDFVDAVSDLSAVNTYTGIWDNRRHQMCKKKIDDISLTRLVQTEKLSRSYVEKRAFNRNKIEDCIVKISKFIK
mgnify:CR=1 FL=1